MDQITANIHERQLATSLFNSFIELIQEEFEQLSERGKLIFAQKGHEHFSKLIGSKEAEEQTIAPSWKLAIKDLEAIKKKAESALACVDPTGPGGDFLSSVMQSATDMIDWIEINQVVTDRQRQAIDNWYGGVLRWTT